MILHIKKITQQSKKPECKLRVAAYARVSVETEMLRHSLAAQISHYSALIQKKESCVDICGRLCG
jgi:resolvase domain protein